MLAWLISSAVRACRRSSGRSTSSPTANMNSSTPIWLSNCKGASAAGGNRKARACGHNRPSRDGPSRMPAKISPITAGWPIRRKTRPSRRAAAMITTICNSSKLSGWCRRSARAGVAAGGGAAPTVAGYSVCPHPASATTASADASTAAVYQGMNLRMSAGNGWAGNGVTPPGAGSMRGAPASGYPARRRPC